MASQLGDTSRQGISRAVDIGSRFFKSGVTPEEAHELAIAVDIGLPDGLRGPQREQNIEIGLLLASVGKSAGFTSAAFAPLFKAITSAGAAGSKEDALKFGGQGIAAQQASPSQSPGAFFTAFQPNTAARFGQGVSQELLLQLMVQGVTGRGGETAGGQGLRKLAETLKLPETEQGFAKLGFPIAGPSLEERLRIANQVLPTLTLEQKRFINAERLSIIEPLFTPAALEAGEKARAAIEAVKPEDVAQRAEEFQQTRLALRTLAENQTLGRRERRSRTTSLEDLLRGIAKKRREEAIDLGLTSDSFFALLSEEAFIEVIVAEILVREGRKVGLSLTDLFPGGPDEESVPFGTIYGVPDRLVSAAAERVQKRVDERGASIDIRVPAFNITNNIGAQFVLDPNKKVVNPRSGQLDPGGAQ
ncbi:MAG: hypothetical protein O7B26_11130 [Planctomycetota bacterium]|nr:hypothetical protein [Planctomycetota bacterium]